MGPREIARGLGRGQAGTLACPLALHVAARIQERDAEDFLYDPTQLANAVRDLVDAVEPDAVPVCDPALLGDPAARTAAVDAAGRLRASLGDRVALVAVLPADDALELGKQFLVAKVDVLLLDGPPDTTLTNIARFHQAVALARTEPLVTELALDAPATSDGLVLTPDLPRDTDLALLREWVDAVRR